MFVATRARARGAGPKPDVSKVDRTRRNDSGREWWLPKHANVRIGAIHACRAVAEAGAATRWCEVRIGELLGKAERGGDRKSKST